MTGGTGDTMPESGNLPFADPVQPAEPVTIGPHAVLLRGLALELAEGFVAQARDIARQAPLRHMTTPGGKRMSVRTTCAGSFGWVTDRTGYRYASVDPVSSLPWPPMPSSWQVFAARAAAAGGFGDFVPDACLVNVYQAGARMGLHQDRDENDFTAPIVSVSLGLPVTFLWGGITRKAPVKRIPLLHGDVLVWGGTSRLAFHGVAPLANGHHALTGPCRVNLTFRKAG